MHLTLRDEDLQFVEQALRSGRYATESEVVAEAIAELRKPNHPAVAILDCVLPGMTGSEICKRMRSVEKLVYLILSSNKSGKEEVGE